MKNFLILKKKQRGFTLVELLVVIAVMGILFLIAIANFSGAEGRNNLKMDAERLAGAFREAQNYAIAQQRVEVPAGSGNLTVPANGFGVEINFDFLGRANKYLIFADTNDPAGFSAEDEIIRIDQLSSGIAYDTITTATGGNLRQVTVAFRPPRGEAVFYSGSNILIEDYLVISLRESKTGGAVRSVRIDNNTGTVVVLDPAGAIIDE
jgi:prepilin-type N-terminal cleavage/methylation domain-containing protein